MFPHDLYVVTVVAEIFFFGFGILFSLVTFFIPIHLAGRASVEVAAMELFHHFAVWIVTIHRIGSDVDFTDVIASVKNVNAFRLHDIVHPVEHVLAGQSWVGFEIGCCTADIAATRHRFVYAVQVESVCIKVYDVGTRTVRVVMNKSAVDFCITGEDNARSSYDVLFDRIV